MHFSSFLPLAAATDRLLILNQWVASNPAISFSWGENDSEDFSRVSNFEFHPTYKLKLSCSGVIGEKMFIIGAEGIAGGMPEVVYEVDDCGVKETEIKLPWYMSAHSCTVIDDVMHICGSQMDLHTKDCVTFDGTSFGKKTSTRNDHSWGAMAEFNGQPVVLGGLLYQAGDTATVETFNGSRWSALTSMPTEKRVFDAIGLGDRVCTFGGYVASSGQATDEITCFDGTSWSNVGNLFTPRYGARVIQYGEAGLLLIGGTAGGTNSVMPFEKIDKHTFESKISKNTLVSYVDWPETFVVPANFCA